MFWKHCFENEWILDLIYFLFDTNFKGIFTGPPPDFKPARNKKYPYYTPLRNANIFSDRQHLSFERKRVIVAVEKRKKAHALLMRYGNTGCGVFKRGMKCKKGFWLKINCSQKKLVNFENCISGKLSTIRQHFRK